ncbi:MAG: hypothetical protein ABSF81_00035 [Bacteroidales bacterium]
MNNLRLNINLLLFLMVPLLNTQDSIFKFKGQVDGYAGLNFGKPLGVQTGVRFLPSLSIGKNINSNLKFDSEISFDSYLDYQYAGSGNDASDSKIKPYRLWIRLSTEQFELRAGLQKINFGSASALRPLMWFDHLDPRDPLQLTDGVYALLGRYYFQNNANAWLWVLWGNDKTMGWETVPTVRKIPEFGGRIQLPVPKGEVAVSYHHRTANLAGVLNPADIHGASSYPEDRIGLDGKWDIGPGVWAEYSLTHSTLDYAYFQPWTKLFTLGIDYTFSLGNGLYAASEFFRYSNAREIFDSGLNQTFSSLTLNYPVGINKIGSIIYYSWTDKSWYRFINLQRQSDNWTYYLFLFWNPEKFAIFNNISGNNMFSGKGIQFMAVFNF